MDNIRLATQEEVEKIRSTSELTPSSSVLAFDNLRTGRPDLAVLRLVLEMDPVVFDPETSNRRKALFAWAVENGLRMQGSVQCYYFNVAANEEAAEWRKTVEEFGATKVSTEPEWRFRKAL